MNFGLLTAFVWFSRPARRAFPNLLELIILIKSNFFLCAVALGLAVSQADATLISFASGSSATSGTMGNTRTFSGDGITVTASAESLIGGVGAWQASYLGHYSNGLGVTNSAEGTGSSGTHTVDNLGSDDRVVFAFSKAVVLDIVGLRQYGDTDISVYYFAGSAWTLLENNFGSNANRNADINSGLVSSSKWAIGAVLPLADDSFKISNITFNVPVTAPPSSVPDAGGSLLLLAIGMGVLIRVQRQTATC